MIDSNKPVPDVDQFYPLNVPAPGTALSENVYPQNYKLPKLFEPLTIKGVTFANRIFVSPMCQYSSDFGHATDWHLVHIGGFASRGVGGICLEATAIVPEGRISPEDAVNQIKYLNAENKFAYLSSIKGLWTDSQIPPLQRIVKFVHAQGSKVGVQIAHAGRKASTLAPWVVLDLATRRHLDTHVAEVEANGWPDDVYGPSDIPYAHNYPKPKALTEQEMKKIEEAYVASIERCKKVGFDFVELHFAHGYLQHTFLSPLSNVRDDQYGGEPLENRFRWPLRIAKLCREAWPDKPLFLRISASDWADALGPERSSDGKWKWWGIQQSKLFVAELQKIGIDLVDVSSGGLWEKQDIKVGPGYQVPFAEEIKKAIPDMLLGSVGMITSPTQAESYLTQGKTDAVFLAREFIRNPHWVLQAAQELGVAVKPACQYERGWTIKPLINEDKVKN